MSNTSGHSLLFLRAPRGLARAQLRKFHSSVEAEVCGGGRFNVLITDDRELQRLNKLFLGKDYATDVLSFPSRDGIQIGEIAISADRARMQAAERGHSIETEISILILHGALHLMGMDHEGDRGRMARAERKLRKLLALPAGLIERAKP